MIRGIGAASAHGALGRTSHNPPGRGFEPHPPHSLKSQCKPSRAAATPQPWVLQVNRGYAAVSGWVCPYAAECEKYAAKTSYSVVFISSVQACPSRSVWFHLITRVRSDLSGDPYASCFRVSPGADAVMPQGARAGLGGAGGCRVCWCSSGRAASAVSITAVAGVPADAAIREPTHAFVLEEPAGRGWSGSVRPEVHAAVVPRAGVRAGAGRSGHGGSDGRGRRDRGAVAAGLLVLCRGGLGC